MHHPVAFAKPLALLAAISALAVAGCGGGDDSSTSSSTASTSTAAPAASSILSAEDQKSLSGAQQAIDASCGGNGDPGSLAGAVAVLTSLYQIDPSAKTSSGQSVEQAVTQARSKLAGCGKAAAAKQLSALVKG